MSQVIHFNIMCDCNTYFVVDYTTGDSICTECGLVLDRDFAQQTSYSIITDDISCTTEDLSSKEPTPFECKATLMYNRMYAKWPDIVGPHSKAIIVDIIHSLIDNTDRKKTSLYKSIHSMFIILQPLKQV